MLQRSSKFGQITKISNISEYHTNLMDDKQDSIWSYKTITLYYTIWKTNIKADFLLRKDQVDTKGDKKDVQILKDEM